MYSFRRYIGIGILLLTTVKIITGVVQSGTENCNNGMDDDGDRLIDCYDPDCTCTQACKNQYFDYCPSECTSLVKGKKLKVTSNWSTSNLKLWHAYSQPIVADLDGDGFPDIIGKKRPKKRYKSEQNLVVYDGRTGTFKYEIKTPYLSHINPGVAVADVDRNGYAEIFFISDVFPPETQNGVLFCYEFNGFEFKQKWRSSDSMNKWKMGNSSPPIIADINQDGYPEIIISHLIYDGRSGRLVARGDISYNEGIIYGANGYYNSVVVFFPVVADILPDSFCRNCAGLELAMGSQVFSVDLSNNKPIEQRLHLEVELSSGSDGYTATCDFDRDGDLDIIYSSYRLLDTTIVTTVWDGQTDQRLTKDFTSKRKDKWRSLNVAIPVLKDVTHDGFPELFQNTAGLFFVLQWKQNYWDTLVTFTTSDTSSGMTGCTIFDLNSDGRDEIIYRDEDQLRIIDATSGTVLYHTFCKSGTYVEYPVVSDIDMDGEAEIVCGCDHALRSFKSGGAPWASTRSIWNQSSFFNVNINDDLTVPVFQQEHHIVGDSVILNNYMIPYSFEEVPAFDAFVDSSNFRCSDSSGLLFLRICNQGERPIDPGTPINIYDSNPLNTTSKLLYNQKIGKGVAPDSCINILIRIQNASSDFLYFLINVPAATTTPIHPSDFPFTAFAECNFFNNLDSVQSHVLHIPVDIGPDIASCRLDSIHLKPQRKYSNYHWQTGATDSFFIAASPGIYWLEVTDECGYVSRDSVVISLIPPPKLNIGNDTQVCAHTVLSYRATHFDSYHWSPESAVDCDTCSSIHLVVDSTIQIIVEGRTDEGCSNRDTVHIRILPPPLLNVGSDTTVCPGTRLEYSAKNFDIYKWSPVSFVDCDSCPIVHFYIDSSMQITVEGWTEEGCYNKDSFSITVFDTPITVDSTILCEGDTLILWDSIITSTGRYVRSFPSKYECDSTHIQYVLIRERPITELKDTVCYGDSVLIFGKWHSKSGVFYKKITTDNVCDSLVSFALFVYPDIEATLSYSSTVCKSKDSSLVTLNIRNNTISYQIEWDDVPGAVEKRLGPGKHQVSISNRYGCRKILYFEIFVQSRPAYNLVADDEHCPNSRDGNIVIEGLTTETIRLFRNGAELLPPYDHLTPGVYTLVIADSAGCEWQDTIRIEQALPLSVKLCCDTTIRAGDTAFLKASIFSSNFKSLRWYPDFSLNCNTCLTTKAFPTQTTRYMVEFKDSNDCVLERSVLVKVIQEPKVFIPNVFTPNGDQANDGFTVFGNDRLDKILELKVFSRWGEEVFYAKNIPPNLPAKGWNGRFNSKIMNPGVFVYSTTVLFKNGKTKSFSGCVTLIR